MWMMRMITKGHCGIQESFQVFGSFDVLSDKGVGGGIDEDSHGRGRIKLS